MAERQKTLKVSYASKNAIGSLFKAVTLSTDPAHTLEFTSSLINAARSALIYKLEQHVPHPRELSSVLNTLLKLISTKWVEGGIIDAESLAILEKRINTMFPSEALMRYDLETYRDIEFCDSLTERWKSANNIYQSDYRAWAKSNELIAEINMQLMEIITRHDLMEFPKGESFNLDDHGTEMEAMAAFVAERRADRK